MIRFSFKRTASFRTKTAEAAFSGTSLTRTSLGRVLTEYDPSEVRGNHRSSGKELSLIFILTICHVSLRYSECFEVCQCVELPQLSAYQFLKINIFPPALCPSLTHYRPVLSCQLRVHSLGVCGITLHYSKDRDYLKTGIGGSLHEFEQFYWGSED